MDLSYLRTKLQCACRLCGCLLPEFGRCRLTRVAAQQFGPMSDSGGISGLGSPACKIQILNLNRSALSRTERAGGGRQKV
jgi:hypothetical protein